MQAQWNNSPYLDMSRTHYANSSLTSRCSYSFLLCAYRRSSKYKIYKWCPGLTRQGLKHTIYHTYGEHANQYTTDVVTSITVIASIVG